MGKKDQGQIEETPQQRAFAEIAAARMADYRQRWLPLQRELVADVRGMGRADSSERKQAAGVAVADNAIRFGEAGIGVEAALASSGGSPGSSKFKVGTAGMSDDQATSRGLGMAGADAQIDDAYLQGLTQIAAMGQGQAGRAIQGMGDVAAISGRQAATDAEISAQRRAGKYALAGQLAGAGLAYAMAPRSPVDGTNDLPDVNGSNAFEQWSRFGVSGD